MVLTPEEIEEIKKDHVRQLELEEAERSEMRKRKEREPKEKAPSPDEAKKQREEEIQKLKLQIEERFFKKRGYRRYVDHRGKVLWLTAEQFTARVARRRRNEAATGGNAAFKRKIESAILYAAVAIVAMIAGYYLTR